MTDEQIAEVWKTLAPWMEGSPISPLLLTFGRAVATAAVEADRNRVRQKFGLQPRGLPLTEDMSHALDFKDSWYEHEEDAIPEDRAALAEPKAMNESQLLVGSNELAPCVDECYLERGDWKPHAIAFVKAAINIRDAMWKASTAALAASPPPLQPAQPVVPEDWQLVPKEPTEAMWDAGRDPVMYRDMNFYRPAEMPTPAWQINPDGTVEADKSKGTTAVHVWRAMIAAAPKEPT